jgi:ubiquinol-cytochrome c reductase cytochrome b subunit
MSRWRALGEWLDTRTGYRAGRSHLLDEAVPSGVGWWFVTGSVLLLLLVVQLLTGVVLAMYYVPAPAFAYDSVRFIMDRAALGDVLRGLHVFGASFIVVAAVVHLLRVVMFGSYKKKRETTWLTGVVLLLLIFAFALTGYLLPWDQKAYWATTVTINIVGATPLVGETIASLLRGGADLGALTLLRWYAVHVFVLPAVLVAFVLAHLFLVRRHGISGPVSHVRGPSRPFYPYHAVKDTIAMAAVFVALFIVAARIPAGLEGMADPTDPSYVPRPEWYFLWLFQLLKYFPGPLEPVATMVIPGLILGGLLLLPFLDRKRDRHPLKRPLVLGSFGLLGVFIGSLTFLGLKDFPERHDPTGWNLVALAGLELATDARCVSCHVDDGPATPIARIRLRKDPDWVQAHVADPDVIAPGSRPAPKGGMNVSQAFAIVSYVQTLRAGATPPTDVTAEEQIAARVFGRLCANCHRIGGGGSSGGSDLTHVGRTRDVRWLREWIRDPSLIDENSQMPAFGDRLSDDELAAISHYLAR